MLEASSVRSLTMTCTVGVNMSARMILIRCLRLRIKWLARESWLNGFSSVLFCIESEALGAMLGASSGGFGGFGGVSV